MVFLYTPVFVIEIANVFSFFHKAYAQDLLQILYVLETVQMQNNVLPIRMYFDTYIWYS